LNSYLRKFNSASVRILFVLCYTTLFTACNYTITPPLPGADSSSPDSSTPPTYTYTVINTFLHDPNAFTQGLVFQDSIFYEGTGLYGESNIRKVTPSSGAVLEQKSIDSRFFGEGITIFGDRLYQLTWKSGVCFVYNKNTFELQTQFAYPTEGWGLTHDGQKLIMSDGTNIIYFRNPETFEEIGRIEVTDNNSPVTYLNELEYIKGQIFANVWQTDRIAQIDPTTGKVTGWINLAGLLTTTDRQQYRVDVLNGIAYDVSTDRLFVTGKWWPKLFEIKLTE
jgi:glutamine cyclotransferase